LEILTTLEENKMGLSEIEMEYKELQTLSSMETKILYKEIKTTYRMEILIY